MQHCENEKKKDINLFKGQRKCIIYKYDKENEIKVQEDQVL